MKYYGNSRPCYMKMSYSKEDAIEAIKKSILKFEVPLKSYKCPFCKKYHLKKKKKQNKSIYEIMDAKNGKCLLNKSIKNN